jgi:hypothetical protein
MGGVPVWTLFDTELFSTTNVNGVGDIEEHIRVGYVVVYVHDICIFTKTDDPQDHLEKLEKVLDSLRQHDLLTKGSKCSLFRTEMEFLGFLVSVDGTRPITSKVEAVVRMTPPETVSQLRSLWREECARTSPF